MSTLTDITDDWLRLQTIMLTVIAIGIKEKHGYDEVSRRLDTFLAEVERRVGNHLYLTRQIPPNKEVGDAKAS